MATVNKIRSLREAAGLSQAQLAKNARTSQQQIQRIEAGVQSARFDLATRIADALGAPLEQVFPRVPKALARARKKPTLPDREEALENEMQSAGIDVDPKHWFLKFRLRGCPTPIAAPISGIERRRIWTEVQRLGPPSRFMIFDSLDRRLAINLDHLLFCQFLYEREDSYMEAQDGDAEADDTEDKLHIQFADGGPAQTFGVDPDEAPLTDESAAERMQQFQHMLFMMEHSTEPNDMFNFEDIDGEHVFFRGADVSMLSLPLWAVEPRLWDVTEVEGTEAGERKLPTGRKRK